MLGLSWHYYLPEGASGLKLLSEVTNGFKWLFRREKRLEDHVNLHFWSPTLLARHSGLSAHGGLPEEPECGTYLRGHENRGDRSRTTSTALINTVLALASTCLSLNINQSLRS